MENKQYKPVIFKDAVNIDKLYSLHYFAYSKSFRFEGESHGFWELIYCDSGEAKITDEGKEFILSGGMAFLHAPDRFHTVIPNNKFTNVVVISFDGTLEIARHIAGKVLPLNKDEKSLIRGIIEEGRAAFSEPLNIIYQFELKLNDGLPAGCLQLIRNALESLIIRLYRKATDTAQNSATEQPLYTQAVVTQILEILKGKINENITLSGLAAKVNYSETYIKKVFKDTVGTSVIQYFIKMKIEKAKQLLSEAFYSVTQVSEMLGFDSVQYFCRQFKKTTNMTPTAYLNSITVGVL